MLRENPTIYDISLLARQLSNSPGANYNAEEISDFCQRSLSEELESGVDRSRQAIGFLTTLNYLEFLSPPTSPSHDIASVHFLVVEMLVALQKPSKILFAPPPIIFCSIFACKFNILGIFLIKSLILIDFGISFKSILYLLYK